MRPLSSLTAIAVVLGLAAAAPAWAASQAMPERGDPFQTPIVPIPDAPPAAEGDQQAKPEELPVMEMTVGEMELIHLPDEASTLIATFPGIVTLGTESPSMLFIFAEQPGETQVIAADGSYQEMFAATIRVTAE